MHWCGTGNNLPQYGTSGIKLFLRGIVYSTNSKRDKVISNIQHNTQHTGPHTHPATNDAVRNLKEPTYQHAFPRFQIHNVYWDFTGVSVLLWHSDNGISGRAEGRRAGASVIDNRYRLLHRIVHTARLSAVRHSNTTCLL